MLELRVGGIINPPFLLYDSQCEWIMAKLNCVFYWYKKLEHEVLNATRLLGYIYIYIYSWEWEDSKYEYLLWKYQVSTSWVIILLICEQQKWKIILYYLKLYF